jgi:hypothetical protein
MGKFSGFFSSYSVPLSTFNEEGETISLQDVLQSLGDLEKVRCGIYSFINSIQVVDQICDRISDRINCEKKRIGSNFLDCPSLNLQDVQHRVDYLRDKVQSLEEMKNHAITILNPPSFPSDQPPHSSPLFSLEEIEPTYESYHSPFDQSNRKHHHPLLHSIEEEIEWSFQLRNSKKLGDDVYKRPDLFCIRM